MAANLLFPIETINRELDFRLFLAVMCARQGGRVFVGQPWELALLGRYMDGGVYLGRPFDPFFPDCDLTQYRMLKEHGITLVHLDEEGAIFPGEEDRWRVALDRQLDPRRLAADDYVCTWGEFQRQHYRSLAPICGSNIHTTGHPRFDLYKPRYRAYYEDEAVTLRARFGSFILVNTNLAYANDAVGPKKIFSKRGGYVAGDPRKRLDHIRFWAHVSHTLANMVTVVTRLSIEFPDTQVVVRPHPSESIDFYQTVFDGAPNIHVVREGHVAPWLLAAGVLLHDGCTTAVEAFLGGLPVVSYKSMLNPQYDQYLPNIFGARCSTEDEVVEAIREGLAKRRPDEPPQGTLLEDRAAALMLNLRCDSFPRLVEVLEEAQTHVRTSRFGTLRHSIHVGYETLKERTKSIVRPLFPMRSAWARYSRSKFFGLGNAGVFERLERIQKVLNKRVSVSLPRETLLVIEGDSSA